MRVCIASVHFLETTFPLAKHLADNNLEVTVFCILPLEDRRSYVIDFSGYKVRHGFDNMYNDIVLNQKLKEYLNKIKIFSFFYPSIRKYPLLNFFLAFKLSRFIKKQKFDIIHIIGGSPFLSIFYLIFGTKCIFHTLHEVTMHEENKSLSINQRFLLNTICRRNIKVILHSSVEKDCFINYYSGLKGNKYPIDKRVFVIPFGLFETYNCYSTDNEIPEEEMSILFFGRILPYKGVTYLIDSVRLLKKKIPSIKLVIAGAGEIDIEKYSDSNIEIINRLLSNEEIIRLIKRSKVIVCPYTSASQSGIPMVAFLFGKPVIATRVGGFPEVIEHMKTGLIIPPKDSLALSEAIEYILTKPEFLRELKNNISNKYLNSELSWQEIANKTKTVYCSKLW